MACEIDDEDVRLIAEALSNAGWHITTHCNDKKAHEDLRQILMALIDAKVLELPVVSANELEPLDDKTAMNEFLSAVQCIGSTECTVQTFTDTVDHCDYGGHVVHKMVKSVEHEVTLKLRSYQITRLVNLLRGSV
jgi:hypothetical protein